MSFVDLRSFIDHLEAKGDLARVRAEVDPNQEITIIQHRVMAEQGPALLFENVKGSPYRLIANLFGTQERVTAAFGEPPESLGQRLVGLAAELMPPSPANVWRAKGRLWELTRARLKTVSRGPVLQQTIDPPDLNALPVLTCWPEDGGPFFTLPLVHTVDPCDNKGNLGIYRLQRFSATTTGMHWQIEKGGGFHFHKAAELNRALPISVVLGGPPALTIAAVAPLPEGIDERLLCALMLGRPLDVLARPSGHRIPARAEFVLEGAVHPGDEQQEGPFGDHFGHYSHSAPFPVFRVERILARNGAIYPATVVGKPPQEDFYIGIGLQALTGPLLKLIKPAVVDMWAYPETGFHPLAVLSVKERYPKEALKHAMGMLGEGQVSLTKVMCVVDKEVPADDIEAVSQAIWRHLDVRQGVHLLAPTAQDTLDFTGPAMNSGSRLVLLATKGDGRPVRDGAPPQALPDPAEVHPSIDGMTAIGPAFLIARVSRRSNIEAVYRALHDHPVTQQYLFCVLVSEDVDLADRTSMLWGWFTRFDPLLDIHPKRREVIGNRLILHLPLVIDATWKEGYPKPVAFDPAIEKRVNDRWGELGIR